MVVFSVDEASCDGSCTPNMPVIFVQYKKGENRYAEPFL